MAEQIEATNTHLTPKIITEESNLVFHNEWDNLNKIKTNVTGNNLVNSAAGIMLQEAIPVAESTQTNGIFPATQRSKKKKPYK